MNQASEASTSPESPRRLYVSVAVRGDSIKVSYGLESSTGERFSVTRAYRPPHGASEFTTDLIDLIEGLVSDHVIEAATGLLTKPLK